MARLDKVHLIKNGNLVCNPGLIPMRYERTDDRSKVTCARCLTKLASKRESA